MKRHEQAAAAIGRILAQAAAPAGPGAALIAVQHGAVLYRGAVGLADVEHGLALDAAHVFRIGSITKQFTAVAILMLLERGQLALSDTIGHFFPDWPVAGRGITLLQLLQHSSGIVNYTALPEFGAQRCQDGTVQQTMALYRDQPLAFAPGTRFAYSNSGYHLLGLIVETVSGLTLADALRQWIFEPLHMQHSALEQPAQQIPHRAYGYSERDGQCVAADTISMTHPYAAGGMVSTLDDLARWNAALQDGELLQQSSLDLAFASGMLADGSPIPYGLGWQLADMQGLPTREHGGAINGFLARTICIPSAGVYVAVLCNRDYGVNCEWIVLQACAELLDLPWPTAALLEPGLAALQRYAGMYQDDDDGTQRHVTVEEGCLFLRFSWGHRVQLLALAEHVFCDRDYPFIRFVFSCNEVGEVGSLAVLTRFRSDSARRVGDPLTAEA